MAMAAMVVMATTAMVIITMVMDMDLAIMAGKGTAGGRASMGGSRRGTSRIERDYGYNQNANWHSGDMY